MISKKIDLLNSFFKHAEANDIILRDARGKELYFEHVANIPYKLANEPRLYCLLRPLEENTNAEYNQALVFFIDIDEENNFCFRIEEDEKIVREIFQKYYALLEKCGSKADFTSLRKELESQMSQTHNTHLIL